MINIINPCPSEAIIAQQLADRIYEGTVMRRGCIVGSPGTSAPDKTWYKVASVVDNAKFSNDDITFFVSSCYGSQSRALGILLANIRTGEAGLYQRAELMWVVAGEAIVTDNFCLMYSDETHAYELWAKVGDLYTTYRFDVISEGTRVSRKTNLWNLYSGVYVPGEEAPTHGYSRINSKILPLLNQASAQEGILTRLSALEAKVGITSEPPAIEGPEIVDTYEEHEEV